MRDILIEFPSKLDIQTLKDFLKNSDVLDYQDTPQDNRMVFDFRKCEEVSPTAIIFIKKSIILISLNSIK